MKNFYQVDFSYVQESYVIVEASDEDAARELIEKNRDPAVEFVITSIRELSDEEAKEYKTEERVLN